MDNDKEMMPNTGAEEIQETAQAEDKPDGAHSVHLDPLVWFEPSRT